VAHLRKHRSQLRQEWSRRIEQSHLLTAMTPQEVHSETTSVYDNYVEVLETGSVEALRRYARDLSERIIPRASRRTRSSASCCCCATCWPGRCSRSTPTDLTLLDHVLDAYEPRPTGSPTRSR
jgi:rsbT co-antagonist protein RsbR